MSQAQAQGHHEEAHASVGTYIFIAVILTVITGLEVLTYYMHIERHILIPMLIVMSAAKFFIVVGWYMHLRYDARIFRRLFLGGLTLAAVILSAIVALFAYHPMNYLLQ